MSIKKNSNRNVMLLHQKAPNIPGTNVGTTVVVGWMVRQRLAACHTNGETTVPNIPTAAVSTDWRGQHRSYLASEENFQVLKRYETNNRIVPLVGDFGGDKAMRAVGRYLKDHADTVAAFYTSNVEGYLHGEGRRQFIRNVSMLPLDERSTFIRTIFTTIAYCSDTMVARRDFNCTRPGPEYQTSTVIGPIRGWLNTWQRE
jgi:hypothetical protein